MRTGGQGPWCGQTGMKLTFVNVGYGEAILLECTDASREDGMFTALIDGGSGEEQEYADRSLGRVPVWEYLQEKGVSHLDLMICTHIHEDHVSGMTRTAAQLPPGELWQGLPAAFYRSMRRLDPDAAQNPYRKKFIHALNDYGELCRITAENGGFIRKLACGQVMSFGRGGQMEVLAPFRRDQEELEASLRELYGEMSPERFLEKLTRLDGRMNHYSLILRILYEDRRILLPGDAGRGDYTEIPGEKLRADLFKVGHHGQKDGVSRELLKMVSPEAAVCCASSDRRYDSAHPDVVSMLEQAGVKAYFSDCPQVPGMEIPPHRALEFQAAQGQPLSGQYIL